MNKKVLIISSSPRKGGNSETLAAAFAKGAQGAGHQVETVFLREKQVGFCKGCLACLNLGHCVIQDDAVEIAAKMHDADVLATAAEAEPETVEGTEKAIQGWVDCFDRCELAATVFAGGVNGIGDIGGHPALDTAYQTGREI